MVSYDVGTRFWTMKKSIDRAGSHNSPARSCDDRLLIVIMIRKLSILT